MVIIVVIHKLLESVLEQSGNTLVMFGSLHCGACNFMLQTMDELINEGYNVFFVNIENEPELKWEYEIEDYPTFLLFKDSELVNTVIGSKRKSDFIKILNTYHV